MNDEDVVHYLRCDAGRMMVEHRRRLASLRHRLDAFREQRLAEMHANKKIDREKEL